MILITTSQYDIIFILDVFITATVISLYIWAKLHLSHLAFRTLQSSSSECTLQQRQYILQQYKQSVPRQWSSKNVSKHGSVAYAIKNAVSYWILCIYYVPDDDDDWVKKCMEYEVEGPRPSKTKQNLERLWQRNIKHVNWTTRILWIVVDEGSW